MRYSVVMRINAAGSGSCSFLCSGAAGRFLADYARGLGVILCRSLFRRAPAVWTALAAAAAFYAFAPRLGAVFAAAIALGGASVAFFSSGEAKLRSISRIALALSVGLAWGAAAALSESAFLPPDELARFTAESFGGTVAADSRLTASGNTMMTIELSELRLSRPGLHAVVSWPRGRHLLALVTDSKEEFNAGRAVDTRQLSVIDAEKALYYASAKNLRRCAFGSRASGIRSAAKVVLSERIAAVSGKSFPLAQALLLGVKDEIDSEEAKLFRDAGCAHILALSGQHLSILCMLMTLFFARLLKRTDLADIASLVFAAAFTWLAGVGPSLLRSALMAFAGIMLRKIDRPQQGITVLALVFCAALGWRPVDARTLSFTLSYAAMAGLILLSPRWETLLWRLPPMVSKPLSASLSALCATALISMSAFGSIAPGGIIAATLSGPVVLVFMWSLLGSSAAGAALPFLNGIFSAWHETVHAVLLSVMRLGALFAPVRLEGAAQKGFVSAAIVALSLFVYAYPYGEYALHELSRRRSRADIDPQESHEHSLRFSLQHKNLS